MKLVISHTAKLLITLSATLLIGGCHTVQGTVNGMGQDINSIAPSNNSYQGKHTKKYHDTHPTNKAATTNTNNAYDGKAY